MLTVYLVLLFCVPSSMVIQALGQVGGPSTLLAAACFLWWLWHLVSRRESSTDRPSRVRGAALLFLAAVTLAYAHSAGLAIPADERAPADGALIRMVGVTGLVCVAVDGIRSWDRLWDLARRWTLLLGALTMLVVVQIVTGEVWVDRLSLPGLSEPQGLALVQRGQITRPSGTSVHPIELASVLAMCMPLVVAVALRERARPWLLRSIAVAVPAVILVSGSRTALVCGAVAFCVMLLGWGMRARLAGLGAALLLLTVAAVTIPGLLGSLRGLFVGAAEDPSVTSRSDSWSVGWDSWSSHPWLGRGVGTFLPRYWIFDNQYLNLLVGGGVVVVGALLVLVVVAVNASLRAARRCTGNERQLAFALAAGIVGGAVSLALFDAFSFPQALGSFFLLVGLAGSLHRQSRSGSASPEPATASPDGT